MLKGVYTRAGKHVSLTRTRNKVVKMSDTIVCVLVESLWGHRMTSDGAEKCQQYHRYLVSSTQEIASRKHSGSRIGGSKLFLAPDAINLVTP